MPLDPNNELFTLTGKTNGKPSASDVLRSIRQQGQAVGAPDPSQYDNYSAGATVPPEQKFLQGLIAALSGAALPSGLAGMMRGGMSAAPEVFNPQTALQNDPWLSYLTRQDPMGTVNFKGLKY